MSYYHSLKRLIQGWWKQLQEKKKRGKKKKEKLKPKHMGHWKALSDSRTWGAGAAEVSLQLLAFPSAPLLLLNYFALWPPIFILWDWFLVTPRQFSYVHYTPKITLPDKW